MDEDILNYSPTVMFRGTPCVSVRNYTIATNHIGQIPKSVSMQSIQFTGIKI